MIAPTTAWIPCHTTMPPPGKRIEVIAYDPMDKAGEVIMHAVLVMRGWAADVPIFYEAETLNPIRYVVKWRGNE